MMSTEKEKGILHNHNKGWDLAICDMDGPREYYAKWNMPDTERQIPYDFARTWTLKIKQKNEWINKQKAEWDL